DRHVRRRGAGTRSGWPHDRQRRTRPDGPALAGTLPRSRRTRCRRAARGNRQRMSGIGGPSLRIEPLRIGMWSGPRNISTAMMRAWENRDDCAVSDEPLYAHYLAHTGADHPARDEVIAAGETDWRKVADKLIGPVPDARPIWYQKHMCHHLLAHVGHEWIHELTNAFLIRDPAAV